MSNTSLYATADLFDQHHEIAVAISLPWISYRRRTAFCGEAVTIAKANDPSCVRHAVEEPGLGKVLVVAGGEPPGFALLGDKLARLAADNGWSGVIISYAVRDVAELAMIDLGIKALGSIPARRFDCDEGASATGTVEIASVIIRPGDWIYADLDGVLVSPEKLTLD